MLNKMVLKHEYLIKHKEYTFGTVLNGMVLKLENVHDDTAVAFGTMLNRMVLKAWINLT